MTQNYDKRPDFSHFIYGILLISHCCYSDYIISDLDATTTYEFNLQATTWSGKGSGSSFCDKLILQGGIFNCGANCSISKNLNNLPAHDTIYFRMLWFQIDSWTKEQIGMKFSNGTPIIDIKSGL